jgi:hypothetical protein
MSKGRPAITTNSFAFVLNLFDYVGTVPIEIAPGFQLDRATEAQRETLDAFRSELGWIGSSTMFELEPISKERRNSVDWNRLMPARSTFWVINFSGDFNVAWEFSHAAQLTDLELEIGAIFPPPDSFTPRVVNPWQIFHFWTVHALNHSQPLEVNDLARAKRLMDQLRDIREGRQPDAAKQAVARVFEDFITVSREHRTGPLALLGHFALLEALITHDPARSGMALTHQIKTKMPLLMRRFERPLPVREYFELDGEQKAWDLLYSVRSKYAHGEEPDFEKTGRKGGAKELRNPGVVFRFVRESLKRLITLALQEPRLVFDLKAC